MGSRDAASLWTTLHACFSQNENQNVAPALTPDVLYVYTTEFGDCSGRVTELNADCYRPSEAASYTGTILTGYYDVATRTRNITCTKSRQEGSQNEESNKMGADSCTLSSFD